MKFTLLTALLAVCQGFQPTPFQKTPSTIANAWAAPNPSANNKAPGSGLFAPPQGKAKPGETVLAPNYKIPSSILTGAPLILGIYAGLSPDGTPPLWAMAAAGVHVILGWYIYTQTDRVRCVFDKQGNFEFKNIKNGELVTKPNKNYVRGTINRWKCNTIKNYGFFPSQSFPLITYFSESETDRNQWGQYGQWGKFFTQTYTDETPVLHFFPGFIDVEAWEEGIVARGATKRN